MGAGVPNYQRLAEIGKLPKDQRDKIPFMKELDDIKDSLCDECKAKLFPVNKPQLFMAECKVEGCEFVASADTKLDAKNILKEHAKSHE